VTEVTGAAADMLPGDVVRDLVERHEQEIESLLADLEEARREADAAEGLVRSHPAFGLLSADEADRLLPTFVEPEPVDGPLDAAGRPRTTVVHRPRSTPPGAAGVGAASSDAVAPTVQSRATKLVTSHWVWKAGVALTVTALLLLKFG
jgi:hypothetical protein